MRKNDWRVVHNNWLWQRAGALETKLLKKYNTSLARISINQRFQQCVMVTHYGENTMEIDYTMYREICEKIESEYANNNFNKGGEQNAR